MRFSWCGNEMIVEQNCFSVRATFLLATGGMSRGFIVLR